MLGKNKPMHGKFMNLLRNRDVLWKFYFFVSLSIKNSISYKYYLENLFVKNLCSKK
jgi:hypothetical protein